MGTHPIFESDFDCLTEIRIKISWCNDSPTDGVWHITPPPTREKSSKRPAVNWCTSTNINWRRCPNAATPETSCGIQCARPRKLAQMSKRTKTVTRAYGGTLCGSALRSRIIRAFLIEEQKIVVKVLKAKEAAQGRK